MRRKEFLRISLPPEDREQLERTANREHMELADWVKRALLRAAQLAEDRQVKPKTTEREPKRSRRRRERP